MSTDPRHGGAEAVSLNSLSAREIAAIREMRRATQGSKTVRSSRVAKGLPTDYSSMQANGINIIIPMGGIGQVSKIWAEAGSCADSVQRARGPPGH